MSLATAPQIDPAPPTAVPFAEFDRERQRRVTAEQERNQAKTRIQRLELERSAFFQILGNAALQPSERITSLFTLFAVEHGRSQGHAIGAYVPVCVKAMSGQAGLSSDTMGKAVSRLAQLGAWKKPPPEECRPFQDEETEIWTTPVVLATTSETLLDNLRVVAQLAPTSDERKALTGKSKPGSRPGERREKIDRACPDCKSTDTRLQCQTCGAITHTDELVDQRDNGQTTEPQLTGTPPLPNLATDPHVAGHDENTGGGDTTDPHVAGHVPTYIEPQLAAPPPEAVTLAPTCNLQVPPSEAPAWLAPRLGDIPQELLDRPQWVAWRAVLYEGRWTKPPMNPHSGELANVSDPATWGTVAEAMAACRARGADGIGFILTAADPYTAVDLDEMDDQTREIVSMMNSYTEISPSGRGVHILVRATKPAGGCRRGSVELYDRGRFLTITGHIAPDTLAVIHERQDELNKVHGRLFPSTMAPVPTTPAGISVLHRSDKEILGMAMNAKNGALFCALWCGDWTGHPSHSEGVWHLLLRLAYWTNGDTACMDRLFRQSGMYDSDDWERPDGSYGTHGQRDLVGAREYWAQHGGMA